NRRSFPEVNTISATGDRATSAVSLLEAKALTRDFDEGHVKALRGADFSIEEGEFVAITGPSGCGKSTLLQLIGSLDRPTSGRIFVDQVSVGELTRPATLRRNAAACL